MKSLIMKDLYNIGHNAKSMILILLVFAFLFVPTSGTGSYVVICGVLCSTMVITTLSFDSFSGWDRYAMIMPVTKKDLVAGKFITLLLFSGIGCLTGLVVGAAGSVILHKMDFSWEGISVMVVTALAGFAASVILGSISLPLVFKFGVEKARMLLVVAFFVPSAIIVGVYQLLRILGVTVSEDTVRLFLYLSPVIAVAWMYGMYRISYSIFAKKEF